MMKWVRRKSSSASTSSKPSFISHVSPLSWLSRFKKMRIKSEPVSAQLKQKGGKQNSPSVSSPQCKSCGNGGRFYGGDDEAFWRLSFGDESHKNKKSKDILKSEVYSLDNGGRWNVKKHERRREGTSKFKENDRDLDDERKSPNDMKISAVMDECNRGKQLENLRRRFERKSQRIFQEQVLRLQRKAEHGSTISAEKDVLEFESPRTIWTPRRHSFTHSVDFRNSGHRGTREDHAFNTLRFQKTERQNLQQSEEFKAKVEKKRQSLHVSREIQRRTQKQSSKVRVNSPRMASKVEICKIKAIEDMRKAKLKMKKAKEKKVEETIEGLDSFAVVKCSLDPQQDFRDSMVEMIKEKQISQPGEMEELLACYLTLNSDEYHDLIIKVFRQVWFDVNLDSLGVKLDKQGCYD